MYVRERERTFFLLSSSVKIYESNASGRKLFVSKQLIIGKDDRMDRGDYFACGGHISGNGVDVQMVLGKLWATGTFYNIYI